MESCLGFKMFASYNFQFKNKGLELLNVLNFIDNPAAIRREKDTFEPTQALLYSSKGSVCRRK